MAFYTSRVDDNGNEIERRHSARSMASKLGSTTTCMDLSSRSCEDQMSLRFVNTAAYIEKTPDPSEESSICDEGKYETTASETPSDIVPPLDLESEENYPTTRDYTFSYRKHCEAAKIVLKPDVAFETWLSAKRKLLSDEAARRKKAEEQKREEQEARKRLSEEKLKSWFENKARQEKNRTREKPKSGDAVEEKPTKPHISEEEAQAKLEEWERIKRLEEERRRMLKRQEEEQRREMEELRRQQAAKAWEQWLADAANKPKPVPLNRGIFTLRGTISDIFVNPNEWKSTVAEPIAEED